MITLAVTRSTSAAAVGGDLAALPNVGTRQRPRGLMAPQPLVAGGTQFKFAHRYCRRQRRASHRVDVTDLGIHAVRARPETTSAAANCVEAVVFDSHDEHRTTGSFVVIDRSLHQTPGAGMVRKRLPRPGRGVGSR